jgi:hypothetical protein
MRIRNWTGAVIAILAASLGGAGAFGAPQSAQATDPAGDVKNNDEPWQDVLSGGVVLQGGTFTFSLKVGAALPADPPKASGGLGWYMWLWGIDSDPDLSPSGWPFPSNQSAPHEFFVILASDGDHYFAFVADRRPLADGEDPIFTPVPFRIRGSSIQVFVDADLLDDPTDFLWSFGTFTAHAHLGTEGFESVDVSDPHFRPWPQD